MIRNIDENPLYDKGIDPIDHKGKFRIFAHLVAGIVGGVSVIKGEKNDAEQVSSDIGYMIL